MLYIYIYIIIYICVCLYIYIYIHLFICFSLFSGEMKPQAWCYSNIACQYWQFSQTGGCFVDAPMLSKTHVVQYPLTTAALTTDATDIIAGEYIHHYCPNQTMADVDDGAASRVPANMVVPHLDAEGPRIWPWVLVRCNLLSEFLV